MGLGVVGAVYTNKSDAVVVRHDPDRPADRGAGGRSWCRRTRRSRPSTTSSTAWKADPGASPSAAARRRAGPTTCSRCSWPRRSTSSPREVNYITYDGGGPLTRALLGEKIDVGMSGLGEFEGQIADGSLRVLAVSGEERLDTVDAPTLTEAGVDLVFTNWRGVLAPPGITDEQRDLPDRHASPRCTTPPSGRTRWSATAGATTSPPARSSLTSSPSRTTRVADTLKELGLA